MFRKNDFILSRAETLNLHYLKGDACICFLPQIILKSWFHALGWRMVCLQGQRDLKQQKVKYNRSLFLADLLIWSEKFGLVGGSAPLGFPRSRFLTCYFQSSCSWLELPVLSQRSRNQEQLISFSLMIHFISSSVSENSVIWLHLVARKDGKQSVAVPIQVCASGEPISMCFQSPTQFLHPAQRHAPLLPWKAEIR